MVAVTWVTGKAVDRSGPAKYLHMLRAADDPARSERPKGGRPDRSPHLTLRRTTTQAQCETSIMADLREHGASTFNAVCVRVWDWTADMAHECPIDLALWGLVERRELEHTTTPPILFRVAEGKRAKKPAPIQGEVFGWL